ncbi:hypothetical protein [Streptomyces sp. NPDC005438]|uniref:hypothetical protein n=1 Tax=Streptomyces sp. NPDC005438 TaxID=3156880 RepID=UPI0033BBC48A
MRRSERERRARWASAGQGTIEYVGLLGIIVLIVGALVGTTVWDRIAKAEEREVCRVVEEGKGDCGKGSGENSDDSHAQGGTSGGSSDTPADDDTDGDDEDRSDGDSEKEVGNALPSVCFEPRERSSNSKVSVPGSGVKGNIAAWGYNQLVNFIIDKINNEKNKEKRVKQALDDLTYCLPDYNIVIAKPHEGNLQQMDGAAMIRTVKISGDTYRFYAFKTGKFVWDEDADLGWKNRAFHGSFDVSEDRRTVTFNEPSRPKRKKDWKPGDEGCQIEGQEPPDRNRYYNTYSPLDNEGSAAKVRQLVNDMRRCYPDYNVVAMHSEQSSHWVEEPDEFVHKGRYRLNSTEYHDDEKGDDIESGRAVFDVYVFDKGKFSNDGDGGYINWAWYGDFERDDMEVSFEQPEPADLDADPTGNGSESVNFNDESPKYTEGTYPGTDYDGKVPGDKGDLHKSLVDEYSKSFPDKNIIAVKSFNDMQFSGISGFEHLAEVDGVNVFAIDDGTITNAGDGGWQNWGFKGQYDYDQDEKTVTFKGK